MNKYFKYAISCIVFFSTMVAHAINHQILTESGWDSCQKNYPGIPYCFPIHAEDSLKDNEVLLIKYSDSSTIFYLFKGATGFTTADNSSPLKTGISISLASVKNHQAYNEHKIYEGSLGINFYGLTCDHAHCYNWMHLT